MEQTAQQNIQMVQEMIQKAEVEKKANLIQQGNKAHIHVTIDYQADSGTEYKGTVIFRRPSSMDYLRVGAHKSDMIRLMGIRPIIDQETGRESMAHVDQTILYVFQAIATMKVLLVESPDWFKDYENSQDPDMVVHVYNRFESELLSFRLNA